MSDEVDSTRAFESPSARPPTAVTDVPFNDLRRRSARLADRLVEVANRVITSGWFLLGPETEAFEVEFAHVCDVQHCTAVANGTDALEVALRSVGCEKNDEVVLTANAGMYAATACLSIGAVPVFADVDHETLLLSRESATSLVTPRTRAVVVTHLYGNVVDVNDLRCSLPTHVAIVEDGSHAHGAALRGHPVGSLGDVAAFSFYPTKNLGAVGDAGAVVSNDEQIHRRARALRQYGWESRYVSTIAGGRNSRIDELQAAFLRELLPGLAERNAQRRAIWSQYVSALSERLHFIDIGRGEGVESTPHLCVARSPRRDDLIADLAADGVHCAIHYPVPDHHQPALLDAVIRHGDLNATERACREVLSLPAFPELREDEICHVIDTVERHT
jgi:dTDP-3-amino-2,3,6-trideoxy-4-keto-D-glucose/dTDP-3-amino-3,4,6-trideoxy-alpha-D-glucose/dTDP-2,6-dideoxy-D-kanosamine transaminase